MKTVIDEDTIGESPYIAEKAVEPITPEEKAVSSVIDKISAIKKRF